MWIKILQTCTDTTNNNDVTMPILINANYIRSMRVGGGISDGEEVWFIKFVLGDGVMSGEQQETYPTRENAEKALKKYAKLLEAKSI